MTPVYQDRFDEDGTGPGNCMQAAVASLLNLPLGSVPDFIERTDPEQSMRWFLLLNGYEMAVRSRDFVPPGYYLVSGISTQGHEHLTVYKDGALAHDPNPHGRGLVSVDAVYWPIPLDIPAMRRIGL